MSLLAPRQAVRSFVASAFGVLIGVVLIGVVLMPSAAPAFFEETFEQRFFFEEEGLVTDHTVVHVPGDGFHIFYAVGIAGQGWMFPDNMVEFGHATSPDLINWTLRPRVLSIVPDTWKDRNLFAPQVIPDPPNGYLMYYTGLDSVIVQATGVARSTDLYDWVDLSPDAPASHPDSVWAVWGPGMWSDGRDPFAFRLGDGVALLSTAMASAEHTGTGNRGALSFAESPDGIEFEDIGLPFFINNSTNVLESSSLFRRPNTWFMFYHEGNTSGIQYMTSESLFGEWDKTSAQFLDPFAFGPSEVFYSGQATLFSRVIDADFNGQLIFGAKIDSIRFTSDTAFYGQTNTLWDRWSVIEGDAFELQPTFGDRPFARGGSPSGIRDHFLINTAERYNGPLGIEDAANPVAYEATGVLRSQPFEITGEHIDFWVGGGHDLDNLYIALLDADDDSILFKQSGFDLDQLILKTWDLTGLMGRSVYFEIVDQRTDGPFGYIAVDHIREGPGPGVGVGDAGPVAPATLRLGQPFPNPVLGSALIPLSLDRRSHVRVAVYDIQGRVQRVVANRAYDAGVHELEWDGRDALGRDVASGIYFLELDAQGARTTRKVVVGR